MYIQQLYTNCLSEAAYYIESDGEAAIIDPLRDIEQYLLLAAERKAKIKYVFETHFHADFVSGHIDLGKTTGAPIIYGPATVTQYPITVAHDGQSFQLGKVTITALHTPGHTLESTCWLLKDEQGKEHAVFTGDTLFIGDVGRPDLSSGNMSSEELAEMLFDSLQNKIKTLPDEVVVYPAHGAGSACGKNLSSETTSTIGAQKQSNYALQFDDKAEFVKAVLTGLQEAPAYFATNAAINQKGYSPIEEIIEAGMRALSVAEFRQLEKELDAVIVDTRLATVFTEGFIPNSISLGLEGRFAEWAASLLPFNKNILLVTEPGREKESTVRLARVGFEKIAGHLAGGMDAWKAAGEKLDMIIDIEPDELAMDMPHDDKLLVLDVRNESEFGQGHIEDALNIPLSTMNDLAQIANIPEDANLYVHCASGYRSVVACSLLKRQGIHNLRNIVGGYKAMAEEIRIKIIKDKAVLN
jgi:glyoxylase-like metal-dependent hydrolase (beta-lactamase superfamily II)/rhodanese-related sulfurtransferase